MGLTLCEIYIVKLVQTEGVQELEVFGAQLKDEGQCLVLASSVWELRKELLSAVFASCNASNSLFESGLVVLRMVFLKPVLDVVNGLSDVVFADDSSLVARLCNLYLVC